MQDGKNNLNRRNAAGMHADRHPAALILNADRAVFFQRDRYFLAEAVERFIDRVIDGFPDQMVQSARIRRPDIHPRTFSDRFQSFQDLN